MMITASSAIKKKVLIVDDEDELREALVFEFIQLDYEVHEARSGNEAYAILQKIKVDIVISDVRMPNGDGIDLLEKIRALDKRLPIVLLVTGFADISEPEAIQKGAAGRIEKPINREKMLRLIQHVSAENSLPLGKIS